LSSQGSVSDSKSEESPSKDKKLVTVVEKPKSKGESIGRPKKNDLKSKFKQFKAQNLQELQVVLDEEEKDENEREAKLRKISNFEERAKLEEVFGIERAKASDRIKTLAKKHQIAEKALAEKLGL
jgi:hypothetical protein